MMLKCVLPTTMLCEQYKIRTYTLIFNAKIVKKKKKCISY